MREKQMERRNMYMFEERERGLVFKAKSVSQATL